MFPSNVGRTARERGLERGRKLEDRDHLERMKKRPKVSPQVWELDAGLPEGATLTALYDLVENAALSFKIETEATGTCYLEVQSPRAPNLGPFSITVGKERAGLFDPWAPLPEGSKWRRFPEPIDLSSGADLLDVIQLSATDSLILLRALRFVPVPIVENDPNLLR